MFNKETIYGIGKKKLIVIAAIGVIIIIGIVWILLPKNTQLSSTQQQNQKPTKTIVPQGAVVNPNSPGGQAVAPTPTPTPPMPTNDQFYTSIVQTHGVLPDANGNPDDFGIVSIKQPIAGWYIVKINKAGAGNAEVIMRNTGDDKFPLTVEAGPGTSFPPEYFNFPDAVRKAL